MLLVVALGTAAPAAPVPITPSPGVWLQPFGVYGVSRDEVVAVTAPVTFAATVTIPSAARLIGAVAVPDRIWTASVVDRAAPLRFRVTFEHDGRTETLWEREIAIATRPADRRWFDFGADLAAHAGAEGTLRFETLGAVPDAPAGTLALWARPELADCSGADPSVLLITLDALRADRLGSYGYRRPTTPHLDAFARDAARFAAAFAAGPKTIPSVPQILTGTHFFHHRTSPGLSALVGDGRFAATRAVVNNPYVATWLPGERPGFAVVVAGELDARAITSEALRFLSATGRCPTALYLHYLDTHTPYHAPARYARRFVDPQAATKVGLTFDDVTGAWQGRYDAIADRQRVADLYDGSLAWTDRQLGRLFRGLARRGLLDRTLVVVTADHGEELWDHGQFFHGQSLFDELLHVPLIIRLPGMREGRVIDALASTVDVLPTVADVLRAPTPGASGRSLRPLIEGDGPSPDRAVFATVSYAEPRTPPRQAVRTDTHKLVREVTTGETALYDLARDPGEHVPVAADVAPGPALRAALDAWRAPLFSRGDFVRVRSRAAAPVRYVVTLATDPAAPLVDPDSRDTEPGDGLAVGPRSSTLTLRGTLAPGDVDTYRLDVLLTEGTLVLGITLDGKPAPDGTLRLGAAASPAAGLRVAVTDPALRGAPTVDPANAPPVTVELWRTTDTAAGAAAPLDAATRARLRELGYVE